MGGIRLKKADVRFIATTHRNLEEMVKNEAFREDLFYRLSVLPIQVPPLRERTQDIPALVKHFCQQCAQRENLTPSEFDEDALRLLCSHSWPGNVRQLQNIVERTMILTNAPVVTRIDVELQLAPEKYFFRTDTSSDTQSVLYARRDQTERDTIVTALERSKGNRTLAARILGISRRTLYNKLTAYNLS